MVKILVLLFLLLLFTGLINGRIIRLGIIGAILFLLVREIRDLKIDSVKICSASCSDCTKFTESDVLRKQFAISPRTALDLQSSVRGNVQIEGWKKDVVEVEIKKRAAKKEDLQKVDVTLSSNAPDGGRADRINIAASMEGSGWLSGSWDNVVPCVDYKIHVPKKMLRTITINVASANVQVDSLELDDALSVKTASGQVSITDVEAAVDVNTSSGQVLIDDVDGTVDVDTSSGFISVKDVDKKVRVGSSSGAVQLKKIDGDASASTSSGSVNMHDVKGDVAASTSSGSINLSDVAGAVTASASSGAITVTRAKNAKGHVKCFTRSGPILVKDSRGNILAQGRGKVTLQ